MKLIATIAFLALCCLSASAQGKIIIGDHYCPVKVFMTTISAL